MKSLKVFSSYSCLYPGKRGFPQVLRVEVRSKILKKIDHLELGTSKWLGMLSNGSCRILNGDGFQFRSVYYLGKIVVNNL